MKEGMIFMILMFVLVTCTPEPSQNDGNTTLDTVSITNVVTNFVVSAITNDYTNVVTNVIIKTWDVMNIFTNTVTNNHTNVLTNIITNSLNIAITNTITNNYTNINKEILTNIVCLTNSLTNYLTNVINLTNYITNFTTNIVDVGDQAIKEWIAMLQTGEWKTVVDVQVYFYNLILNFSTPKNRSVQINKDGSFVLAAYKVSLDQIKNIRSADIGKGIPFAYWITFSLIELPDNTSEWAIYQMNIQGVLRYVALSIKNDVIYISDAAENSSKITQPEFTTPLLKQ